MFAGQTSRVGRCRCRETKRQAQTYPIYYIYTVLCYCLICWGGSLSVKNRVLLDRVVRSASKTIGSTLPTVDELYETYMMKKTRDILKDTSHPLHEFYYVAQSGCRYISERTRTNRYRNTFLPTSVRLLNAKSGRGK